MQIKIELVFLKKFFLDHNFKYKKNNLYIDHNFKY
jgi:hypothetical protein